MSPRRCVCVLSKEWQQVDDRINFGDLFEAWHEVGRRKIHVDIASEIRQCFSQDFTMRIQHLDPVRDYGDEQAGPSALHLRGN